MAREESDREDLMREATALVRRAELSYAGLADENPVIAGFRRDGRLAVYFGPDPVYQFDEKRRLRRAYAEGFLYRTQGETLARLSRNRTRAQTELIRYDLNPDELKTFLDSAKTRLLDLREAILAGTVEIRAQIPTDGDLLGDLERALTEILDRNLPLAPPIPGKK